MAEGAARLVGGHELLDELGRGGMGRVFRAREVTTGVLRALKVLEATGEPEAFERFQREAQALARVGRGVVPIHASGLHHGRPWFVMDLVEGGSLEARLKARGRFAWEEAVALVAKLARTLERLAALGLVHRDVKPANVLLDGEGEPLLADLGCVRDLGGSRLTATGTILGTPQYMAPEQIDGLPAGPAADVFAAGVMLYELVTGERPHAGRSIFEVAKAVLTGTRRPPSALVACPAALDRIVERALASEPEGRPSAGELAAMLEGLLAGKEIDKARPIPASVRALVAVAVVGVILVGVVAVGGFFVVGSRGRGQPRPVVPTEIGFATTSSPTVGPSTAPPGPVTPVFDDAALRTKLRSLDPAELEGAIEALRARKTAEPTFAPGELVAVVVSTIDAQARRSAGDAAAQARLALAWDSLHALEARPEVPRELVRLLLDPLTKRAGTSLHGLVAMAAVLLAVGPGDESAAGGALAFVHDTARFLGVMDRGLEYGPTCALAERLVELVPTSAYARLARARMFGGRNAHDTPLGRRVLADLDAAVDRDAPDPLEPDLRGEAHYLRAAWAGDDAFAIEYIERHRDDLRKHPDRLWVLLEAKSLINVKAGKARILKALDDGVKMLEDAAKRSVGDDVKRTRLVKFAAWMRERRALVAVTDDPQAMTRALVIPRDSD